MGCLDLDSSGDGAVSRIFGESDQEFRPFYFLGKNNPGPIVFFIFFRMGFLRALNRDPSVRIGEELRLEGLYGRRFLMKDGERIDLS